MVSLKEDELNSVLQQHYCPCSPALLLIICFLLLGVRACLLLLPNTLLFFYFTPFNYCSPSFPLSYMDKTAGLFFSLFLHSHQSLIWMLQNGSPLRKQNVYKDMHLFCFVTVAIFTANVFCSSDKSFLTYVELIPYHCQSPSIKQDVDLFVSKTQTK